MQLQDTLYPAPRVDKYKPPKHLQSSTTGETSPCQTNGNNGNEKRGRAEGKNKEIHTQREKETSSRIPSPSAREKGEEKSRARSMGMTIKAQEEVSFKRSEKNNAQNKAAPTRLSSASFLAQLEDRKTCHSVTGEHGSEAIKSTKASQLFLSKINQW
ncbi:Hypothetical predicted protein [Podarcis lilfordi]|uniref:Uncharacterized protein n=1 Tax=Podarcis lilfordi TaxID=74358 RepID=A0AA35NUL0_9SAUR|nr:Hypothetical predicted protein [Podarcis lilfordi]